MEFRQFIDLQPRYDADFIPVKTTVGPLANGDMVVSLVFEVLDEGAQYPQISGIARQRIHIAV
jgi:hypothetical protein